MAKKGQTCNFATQPIHSVLMPIKKIIFAGCSLCGSLLVFNGIVFNEHPGFHSKNIALSDSLVNENVYAYGVEIEDINQILNQPFSYLAHGKQAFAFQSADGKYVLKWIKTRRVRPKRWFYYWQNWLKYATPLPIYKHFARKKELAKLCGRFTSACKELSQQTEILYVHAVRTQGIGFCQVTDAQGNPLAIDLDKSAFVIQRKAVLVPEYLDHLLSLEDKQGAKEALNSLKILLAERVSQGFSDERQVFHQNFGFYGNRPIQIDIGKIHRISIEESQTELKKAFDHLKAWIEERYPQLADEF